MDQIVSMKTSLRWISHFVEVKRYNYTNFIVLWVQSSKECSHKSHWDSHKCTSKSYTRDDKVGAKLFSIDLLLEKVTYINEDTYVIDNDEGDYIYTS